MWQPALSTCCGGLLIRFAGGKRMLDRILPPIVTGSVAAVIGLALGKAALDMAVRRGGRHRGRGCEVGGRLRSSRCSPPSCSRCFARPRALSACCPFCLAQWWGTRWRHCWGWWITPPSRSAAHHRPQHHLPQFHFRPQRNRHHQHFRHGDCHHPRKHGASIRLACMRPPGRRTQTAQMRLNQYVGREPDLDGIGDMINGLPGRGRWQPTTARITP